MSASGAMDLMPAACRSRLRGRSASRRWMAAYISIASVGVLGVLGLRVAGAAASGKLRMLERDAERNADFAREAQSLDTRIQRVASQIDQRSRIAWPIPLSDVLALIADALPEPVALTSLVVTPRLEAQAPPSASGTSAGGAPNGSPVAAALPQTPVGITVEMTGLAPTDQEVAGLLAGLEDRGLFQRVTMDHARSAPLGAMTVREFGLTCEIDLLPHRRGLVVLRAPEGVPAGGAK